MFFLADAAATLSDALPTLLLLIGLELVLGVDNVLVISILSNRLPEAQRPKARLIGLTLAMLVRVAMLFGVTWLLGLDKPLGKEFPVLQEQSATRLFAWLSWKDLILVTGGLFLLYKAVVEIHHTVEMKDEHGPKARKNSYWAVIGQIVALDIVFSIDSVITAVGMTKHLWVIISAVVLSFVVILAFARPIGEFILRNPALKILALAFLVTIGVTIFMEGMHRHVEKAYIYLPMGFALGVELLQMRHSRNAAKNRPAEPGADPRLRVAAAAVTYPFLFGDDHFLLDVEMPERLVDQADGALEFILHDTLDAGRRSPSTSLSNLTRQNIGFPDSTSWHAR